MTATAFVAGATGYTGREVVSALCQRGVATWAHVRPDSARLPQWRTRFEAQGAQVDTTPWDEAALEVRLRELSPELVFALLGTTRARARDVARKGGDPEAHSYHAVDYGLSALLMRATRRATPEARFVYLSALGVRSKPDPGRSYGGARARMEHELEHSGLPYVIARPGFISGDDRDEPRPLERLAARTTDGLLQAAAALGAKRFRDHWHSMSGAQLGRALVSLALDDGATSDTYGPAELRARSGH